jgi:hypothetical protein
MSLSINPKNVHLISAQKPEAGALAVLVHNVVIADTFALACERLSVADTSLMIVGHARLHDLEAGALAIRAALSQMNVENGLDVIEISYSKTGSAE